MVLPRLAFLDLQFSAIGGFWFFVFGVCLFILFVFGFCVVFFVVVLFFVFIHLRERAWWEGAEERETPKLIESPYEMDPMNPLEIKSQLLNPMSHPGAP